MQLNYYTTSQDQGFLRRIFLFLKRNYWLYSLEVILLLIIVLPPYQLNDIKWYILIGAAILIRDVFVVILNYKYLGEFVSKGNKVSIGIIHGSKMHHELSEWLPELDLEIRYKFGSPVLHIVKGKQVIYKQYAIGVWTLQTMNEFISSFYEYKKEQALWKMYKGQE